MTAGSKLSGIFDFIFCHESRSAKSSLTSWYPLMLGSFAILSASSIAETVSLLGVPSVILKGIPLSRRDWRTKILKAVLRFIPSSS